MTASDLKSIPFLSAVPLAELEPWAELAEAQSASRRETLVPALEEVPFLYLVRSGVVILCLESRQGETRMTGLADSSQAFNIQCLHPGVPLAESAHALTDAEVVRIPAEAVRASVARGGVLATLLAGFAAGRLAEMADDFVRATTLDVRARTAVALLRLSQRLGTLNIPVTQEQLAGIVGTRRETLALILGAYRDEETLDTRYRMIKILSRERLAAASKDGFPVCVSSNLPWPITGNSVLAALAPEQEAATE